MPQNPIRIIEAPILHGISLPPAPSPPPHPPCHLHPLLLVIVLTSIVVCVFRLAALSVRELNFYTLPAKAPRKIPKSEGALNPKP